MTNLDPGEIFFDKFKDHLNTEDYMEFYSGRITKNNETSIKIKSYPAEKLSKVVLEDYAVRGKLRGKVIIAYPSPLYDVPFFFFQLGGANQEKSLAVLDISPTLPDIDYEPLKPVHIEQRNLLNLQSVKPSSVDWMNSVCSPYLLKCVYKPLNHELFIKAMLEYFNVWYENYYKPGIRSTDKKKIKTATKSIYKFKHTLHHNDPSYGVIVRACGKETADAYFHLEYGDYPALTPPKKFKTDFKIWENKKLGIKWTKDAQEKVMEAPQLVQLLIRKTIESRVFEARIELITDEIFEQFKSNRPV